MCSINVSILCLFSVSTMSAISANISSIPKLNNSNFKNWKEHVMTVLGCLDLDHVFRLDRPALVMHHMFWVYKSIGIVQDVYLAYHKRPMSIRCLKGLICRIVHQVIHLWQRVINSA